MSLLAELRKRRILQVGLAYLALAWLLVQVAVAVFPAFDMPRWTLRLVILLLALGLPVALLMAWALVRTPDGIKVDAPAKGGRTMLAIVAVLVAASLVWFFSRGGVAPAESAPPASTAVARGAPAATAPSVPERSIAVLPLVNASSDPEQVFFSDGLSENLIDTLSRFDGMKVVGRISSFQFRDSRDDSATIGRKLGVAYLLNGSVQRSGSDVRVRVSLTRAADGSTLWAQHYDRPYQNLFGLQDDIAQAVADALRVKLLAPGAGTGMDDRPPGGNIAAYDAYLRGLKYWYDQEFPQAAEHMAEAVRIDPDYALAWARLSESLSTAVTFWPESSASDAQKLLKARQAGDAALRLAPALGAAHTAQASLAFYGFDFAAAERACQHAVPLAPEDGMVLNSCGYTLGGIGRIGEAMRLRERLLTIEPLYDVNHFEYAWLLLATGRLDDAEKYLRIGEGLSQPNALLRLVLALARGDTAAARAAALLAPEDRRALFVALAAQLSPGPAADAALAAAIATPAGVDLRALRIAQTYALRGDARNAVTWLRRTAAEGRLFLLADPLILRLRDDPLFIAFCREAGLGQPAGSEALGINRIRAMQSGG